MNSGKRNALIVAVASLGAAYAFYRTDTFWGIVTCSAIFLWSLVMMLPVLDGLWRLKTGFVASTFFVAFISLWPTLHGVSHGKIPCPVYVQDRIHFGIVKGLDLQGGARFVYTVEVEDAIRDKRDHFADEIRHDLAVAYQFHTGDGILTRETQEKLKGKVVISTPQSDSAVLKLKFTEPGDLKAKIDDRFQQKFLRELAQHASPTPNEVVFKIKGEVETDIRNRAVQQAKETINRRVDELGLREASLTVRDENIIIEVPGQDKKDFDNIKETVRRTARLEFKMVDDEADFIGQNVKESELPESEGISIYPQDAPAGVGRTVKNHFARIAKKDGETMQQCRERFKAWAKTLPIPDDHQLGFEPVMDYDEDSGKTTEGGWKTFYLYSRADVTGEFITDAQRAIDQSNGSVYVSVTFSPAGADRFEQVTGANINRRFAIILDDTIDSAPVIRSKIGGGRASITMGQGGQEQQLESAKKLELVLRSGALPAPITLDTETQIGPTLGADAISKGVTGAIAGSILVLIFMVIYYRKSGIVADIAVLFNLMLQMAFLASASATMTLPGIAGLALTIGMAVDANVLINERIREELRAGRSIRAAVDAGYDKAFWSIFDGHVTVFISGLILAQYGSGPVKGFAITLIVGIIASLFTGVFCTRLVFDYWVRHRKVKMLSVGITVASAEEAKG